MKFSLILLLLFSVFSHAEEYKEYKRGVQVCTDESEEIFKHDSADLDNRYLYASCLVIKGLDSQGLPQLYILSDQHSHLLASYFLAQYLETDGRFEYPMTHVTIEEASKYYMRSQALIKLMPNYPPEPYEFIERDAQIELASIYKVPHLYLLRYNLGIVGDYYEHLLQSPSYEGDRDKETYSKYNTFMRDSLNNAIRYAGECAGLLQKEHFNLERYQATVSACRLMKGVAVDFIPLEEKRQEILRQSHCQDLNKTNCPEYYETHQEIKDILSGYMTEYNRLFENL